MAIERQIVGVGHERREHEPLAADAARRGLAPQVRPPPALALEEPEHAAVDGAQQPHPDVEYLRHDLEAVVEAAEDETSLRQTDFAPRRRVPGDRLGRVVGLVRVREIGDLLVVVLPALRRDQRRVGNQVVDIGRPHRAGIAEPARLHRGRARGEDAGTRALRVALEIDGEVDAIAATGTAITRIRDPRTSAKRSNAFTSRCAWASDRRRGPVE